VPSKLPMTDAQVSAEVASYVFNPNTKFREFLFACRINPKKDECFS
jgi:hypothetical protein